MLNILLPTDFSENATNAISYALNLFKKEKCTFFILNTYTPAITHSRFMAASAKGEILEKCVKETSEKGIVNTLNFIKTNHRNPLHHYKSISSFDLLIHEIVDIVQREKINYVFSGTKGITNFERVFIGTNTMRIIKAVKDCPVIAIPNKNYFEKPKQLLFPTDLKRSLSPEAVSALVFVTKIYKCNLHIMHIKNGNMLDKFQQSNLKILQNYFPTVSQSLHLLPYYANKSEIISAFIKDNNIDLMALTYNNRSYLEEIIKEPVIPKMDYHTKIPLLILPT